MSRCWHQVRCHVNVYKYSPWVLHSYFLQFWACKQPAIHSNPLIKARVHDCNVPNITIGLAQALTKMTNFTVEMRTVLAQSGDESQKHRNPSTTLLPKSGHKKDSSMQTSKFFVCFFPRAHTSTATRQLQTGKQKSAHSHSSAQPEVKLEMLTHSWIFKGNPKAIREKQKSEVGLSVCLFSLYRENKINQFSGCARLSFKPISYDTFFWWRF